MSDGRFRLVVSLNDLRSTNREFTTQYVLIFFFLMLLIVNLIVQFDLD